MDCIEAHKYSFANKTMLKNEKKCGCFYGSLSNFGVLKCLCTPGEDMH